MANTELLALCELTPADVPEAMKLSTEAGWNQTEDDWRLMLTQGYGIGLKTQAGLVASGMALPMGRHIGWISMVLVTASFRRRGLATRIMEAAIRQLEGAGRSPGLDATPAGAAVYSRMGFVGITALSRWQCMTRQRRPEQVRENPIEPIGPETLDDIATLDAEVSRLERKAMLAHLLARGPAFAAAGKRGFVLSRPGRVATQVGPLTARDSETAFALLGAIMSAVDGPVFIDVFDAQAPFAAWLQEAGFSVQRPFVRMVRGDRSAVPVSAQAFAAAGPELG